MGESGLIVILTPFLFVMFILLATAALPTILAGLAP